MKLWKDNRTDKEYELSYEEIFAQFKKSKYAQREQYLDRKLRDFICCDLNSVYDEKDYQSLYDFIYQEHYKEEIPY